MDSSGNHVFYYFKQEHAVVIEDYGVLWRTVVLYIIYYLKWYNFVGMAWVLFMILPDIRCLDRPVNFQLIFFRINLHRTEI